MKLLDLYLCNNSWDSDTTVTLIDILGRIIYKGACKKSLRCYGDLRVCYFDGTLVCIEQPGQ